MFRAKQSDKEKSKDHWEIFFETEKKCNYLNFITDFFISNCQRSSDKKLQTDIRNRFGRTENS